MQLIALTVIQIPGFTSQLLLCLIFQQLSVKKEEKQEENDDDMWSESSEFQARIWNGFTREIKDMITQQEILRSQQNKTEVTNQDLSFEDTIVNQSKRSFH